MDVAEELQSLGFTANETKVYLTLLRVGRTAAGRLSKEAGLERTSTYDALTRLMRQGLASFVVESGTRIFSPVSPSKLPDVFKEREARAALLAPRLQELVQFEKERENILKFRGLGGIKSVLNDVLRVCKEGEEYLVIGMEGQLSQLMPTFAKIYVARKDEKKLRCRAIMREKLTGAPVSKYTSVRYIPRSNDPLTALDINVYGQKVAFIVWSTVPEAVIIDNPQVASAFRVYFEFMWSNAKA